MKLFVSRAEEVCRGVDTYLKYSLLGLVQLEKLNRELNANVKQVLLVSIRSAVKICLFCFVEVRMTKCAFKRKIHFLS